MSLKMGLSGETCTLSENFPNLGGVGFQALHNFFPVLNDYMFCYFLVRKEM